LISIIIPCFNSGSFLLESVESCFHSEFKNFEIIIVDDGSHDPITISLLEGLDGGNEIKVFRKPNGGPASARNFGVLQSQGDFLLFLDSDNRIHPDYLSIGLNVLFKDPFVGVVYSKPRFFGDNRLNEKPRFVPREFSRDAILAGNYIDTCSIVRRETFLEVGGFDEHPDLIGWEDADLWIRISQTKWKFHFLDQVLFDYRVRVDSLMGTIDSVKRQNMLNYIGNKHGFLFHERYRQYFRVMEKIQENPISYFLRILYYKYILRKPFIK
jgi:glycosyltransferase involved in cell wall biosynthesis